MRKVVIASNEATTLIKTEKPFVKRAFLFSKNFVKVLNFDKVETLVVFRINSISDLPELPISENE